MQAWIGASSRRAHLVEHAKEARHRFHCIGDRVDADHRVAGTIHQAIDNAGGDPRRIIGRMVRLQAGGKAAGSPMVLRKAVTMRHLPGDRNEILQAHDLAYGRRHFRRQPGREPPSVVSSVSSRSSQSRNSPTVMLATARKGGIMGVDDQPRDLVGLVGDNRIVQEFAQRQVAKRHLRRHPLRAGRGGNAGKLVARASRRCFGKQFLISANL